MRKSLISSRSKEKYKRKVEQFVDGMGRFVHVYKPAVKNECDNCYFDSLTNKSTGKCKWTSEEAYIKQHDWELAGNNTVKYKYFVKGRCPVCAGIGYTELVRRKTIKCIVNWDPDTNDILQTQAGNNGTNLALLKTDPSYTDLFVNSTKVVVDGVDCVLASPPLLRGLGNDSILFVYVFTNKKLPENDTAERIKKYHG